MRLLKKWELESKQALTIGIGIFLFLVALIPPVNISVDGNSMFWVAVSLVTQHNFESSSVLGMLGTDGKYYSIWYPLLSILEVPFVWFGFWVSKLLHAEPYKISIAAAFCFLLPAFFVSATSSVVFLISKKMQFGFKNSFLLALGMILGTFTLVYSRSLFADSLLTFLMVSAVYFTQFSTSPKSLWTASFFSGLSVLAKPTGIFLGPLLSLYLWIEMGRETGREKKGSGFRMLIPSLGTLCGTLIYFYYNDMRFGGYLNFGSRPSLSLSHFPIGLMAYLFSPGYSLFWFNPVTLLALVGGYTLFKKTPQKSSLFLWIPLFYLALYSCWPAIGWEWGPRHLLLTLPFLFILIGGALETPFKKYFIPLVCLGFLIQSPNLVSFYERYYFELEGREFSIWSPTQTPLLQVWGSAFRQVSDANSTDVKSLVQQSPQRSTAGRSFQESLSLKLVALWWWILPGLGISRIFGFIVFLSLIGLSFFILRKIYTQGLKHETRRS